MKRKLVSRLAVLIGTGMLLVVGLFEVSFDPKFELPDARQTTDPAQDARFDGCFAERDANIHERAFANIDNPDVQREFISTERDKARNACRATFPQRYHTERLPFRFNLIDLRFRY